MADRWAFVFAIDKHLDPALGTTPYAEAGAKAVADALASAGYPKANQFVLLGPHATKAAAESRLRVLKRSVRKGDDVLAFVAGRGFGRGGAGFVACWDTLPDDLTETSLAVADLLAALAAKAGQVAVLLDVGAGPPVAGARPHLDSDELAALFDASPKAVGLAASHPEEPSHAAAGLKGSAWAHLLADALSGRAPKAAGRDGRVTALSLHRFAEGELPRLLRKHFEAGVEQAPRLYGGQNAGLVVADPGRRDPSLLLDADRLRRVVFRSESTGRVKDLTNWRKTFDLPDSARPSATKFVARIAAVDLRADLDAVFEASREHLGYKRKDLDLSAGNDGSGYLRTPEFEYAVTLTLDADDPTQVVWRREVGQFADPGFVRGPGFDAVFGKLFDQLAFEFTAPVDVPALVDRLEDRPPKGAKVTVASDGRSCDVTLAGFAGRVTVDRNSLTVRGRGDSAGLLDQFLAFLRTVGPLGEPLALPPAH